MQLKITESTLDTINVNELFPKAKDLPEGVDLRKQLITVLAYIEHNTSKSKDDEYLFNLLVINFPVIKWPKIISLQKGRKKPSRSVSALVSLR